MFIEFTNTEGEPFTVSLLQLKSFRPMGSTSTGGTMLLVSDVRPIVTNSPYDEVKDRIAAMTK